LYWMAFIFLMIFSGSRYLGSELRLFNAILFAGLVYVLAILNNFFKWAQVNYPVGDKDTHPTNKEDRFQN